MGGRPELFPTLLQKLQSPDVLTTQRVYLVLNQTLKELSTKRLAADQRNFAEVCCLNHLHQVLICRKLTCNLILILFSRRSFYRLSQQSRRTKFQLHFFKFLLCYCSVFSPQMISLHLYYSAVLVLVFLSTYHLWKFLNTNKNIYIFQQEVDTEIQSFIEVFLRQEVF